MIDFRLYLITDRRLCTRSPLTDVVDAACRAGVRAVQLRERDLSTNALYELACDLLEITRAAGAGLFVNDRVDVALALKTEGVHCPEHGFPPARARKLLGERAAIGASAHSLEGAARARDEGADFVLFGPVFDTPAKTGFGSPQGLEALSAVASKIDVPVFAVGGITPDRAARCREHGASGVALVSALMAAEDIARTVEEFGLSLGAL
jgi:thiamine-phosphate pyrophosphorylase